MEKTGFIYIWYDRKRKMFYIGCHLGSENDGYICSSNRMRDAYRRRPQDFKRRILKRDISRNMILQEEYKWLTLIPKEQLGEKYYNLSKTTPPINIPHNKQKNFEQIKKNMSEAAKRRDSTPYRNRMNVKHKETGWQGKINCSDFDPNIHESLVCRTNKKVTVIDENGNSFAVTKEEYQKNKGKWKTHSSIFNKGRQPIGGGEACKGTVPVFTPDGKCIRVPKNDPKILSGEYILQCSLANKGKITINNGIMNKRIFPDQLYNYSDWNRGLIRGLYYGKLCFGKIT